VCYVGAPVELRGGFEFDSRIIIVVFTDTARKLTTPQLGPELLLRDDKVVSKKEEDVVQKKIDED
jgi:hypothetical protein